MLSESRQVYGLLAELGFRTTKGVWVIEPPSRNSPGETCASERFRQHARALQEQGFEIGYHNGAPGSLTRAEVIRSLDLFREYFGHDPVVMANHYNADAMYWGPARVSGARRLVYTAATLGRAAGRHFGEIPGHPSYWGDVCAQRVKYCRNFVFREINTLKACPWMPYHDPERALVPWWYASAEGSHVGSYTACLSEANQDRLEAEGGACIMYTHFGHGFVDDFGKLQPEFRRLMERLSRKNGWFAPVSAVLDHLLSQGGKNVLHPAQRNALERRWLSGKFLHGTS